MDNISAEGIRVEVSVSYPDSTSFARRASTLAEAVGPLSPGTQVMVNGGPAESHEEILRQGDFVLVSKALQSEDFILISRKGQQEVYIQHWAFMEFVNILDKRNRDKIWGFSKREVETFLKSFYPWVSNFALGVRTVRSVQ